MGYATEFADFAIADVASMLGLHVVKTHGDVSLDYVCPFCGRKKLNANITNNKFRCAACGEYGNSQTLYAKLENISNSEAYKRLCNSLKPQYAYTRPQPKAQKRYVPDKELRAFFAGLGLSVEHRQNLNERGLDNSAIDKYGFKSVPLIGQSNYLLGLQKNGVDIYKIPGVYKLINSPVLNINGRGILVPSYYGGVDGKLRGVQIRLDKYYKRKYIWLSATNKNGASSGSPLTYLIGENKEFLFITEGILKAIIFHELTGYSVIGIPGVSCQSEIPFILKKSSCKTVFNIFDMDYITNVNVKRSELELERKIKESGKKYIRLVWDKRLKGIDNYVVATGDFKLKQVRKLS